MTATAALVGLDLGHFYDSHVTLMQATLCGMILASSVQVAMRAGVFSLASVGFWGIGAYTSGILARDHGQGVFVSVAAGVAVSAVISYGLARLFHRLRSLYLAMATVSFNLVVVVVALRLDGLTGGALGLYAVPAIGKMWQLILVTAGVGALLAYLERGHIGRTIATAGADEDVAGALGINVEVLHRRAFVLSAALGALSGAMSALLFNNVSTEQFGFGLVTLSLSMAVIGGLRSWLGAFIGAVIVYWLPELLRPVATWRQAVYGLLLIVVVTLEPGGVLGLARRLRQRFTRRAVIADENEPVEVHADAKVVAT